MDRYLKLFYYINNVYIQLHYFIVTTLFDILLVSKVRPAIYRLQEFSFRERQVYTDLLAFT